MKSDITKVTAHINHNEALIFERSQPGRIGYRLPPLDVEEQPINTIVPQQFLRDDDLADVPEVSEVDVIRHFIRMSTWNYSIDLGMYPLGSCTMKYNSRLNEKVARIPGFAGLHPLIEAEDAQGALQVIHELQQHLAEITDSFVWREIGRVTIGPRLKPPDAASHAFSARTLVPEFRHRLPKMTFREQMAIARGAR